MVGENNERLQQAALRRVSGLMQKALHDYGFTRQGDCLELELSQHAVGVLCLGIGAIDPVEVYATVGVRFREIETLANRLQGINRQGEGWTIGVRLGDLLPLS